MSAAERGTGTRAPAPPGVPPPAPPVTPPEARAAGRTKGAAVVRRGRPRAEPVRGRARPARGARRTGPTALEDPR